MIVGWADGTGRASADAHTILAVGPILALIGLFVGGFWGIARAQAQSHPDATMKAGRIIFGINE